MTEIDEFASSEVLYAGPFFVMCVCGRHGFIATMEKYLSGHVFSRQHARLAARDLLKHRSISQKEFEYILYGIKNSPLPETVENEFMAAVIIEFGSDAAYDEMLPKGCSKAHLLPPPDSDEMAECIHDLLARMMPERRVTYQ